MSQALPIVLYIEDNPLNLELVSKSLRAAGYLVLGANSGEQGISMAIHHRPDLVLMDLHLSDMSGVQVAACLREHPLTKHAAIVALTATMVGDQAQWCKDNDFDDFLAKPVSRLALLNAAQRWAAQPEQLATSADDLHQLEQTQPSLDWSEDTKPDRLQLEETHLQPLRFTTKPCLRQNVTLGS
ncbi:MAG: response regulator [Anaerolineae bacterium]|nr:response regulator [Anaerolineae bacterium]MDW8171598.1 response regulator [Anaerolineae bacterium]